VLYTIEQTALFATFDASHPLGQQQGKILFIQHRIPPKLARFVYFSFNNKKKKKKKKKKYMRKHLTMTAFICYFHLHYPF